MAPGTHSHSPDPVTLTSDPGRAHLRRSQPSGRGGGGKQEQHMSARIAAPSHGDVRWTPQARPLVAALVLALALAVTACGSGTPTGNASAPHATPTPPTSTATPSPVPPGQVREFPLPTANSAPGAITAGPDGALWFTEGAGNRIGRITPGGVAHPPRRLVLRRGLAPSGATVKQRATPPGAKRLRRAPVPRPCPEPHRSAAAHRWPGALDATVSTTHRRAQGRGRATCAPLSSIALRPATTPAPRR